MSDSKYIFKAANQSPWLVEVYNEYLPYKTDGFLVEIGVGHTIQGIDRSLPDNLETFERCSSNTADLLDLGWSGIYIEPVEEYCKEVMISQKDNLSRLQVVNMGASNVQGELPLYYGDSFVPNEQGTHGYSWIGRVVQTDITSKILRKYKCPKQIDLMSIDVEGFEPQVIQGIDFKKHNPYMIVIETDKVSPEEITNLLPTYYTNIKNDGLNGVWISNKNI